MPHTAENLSRLAFHVAEKLREAGHQAYYAGGSVRDRLLGIPPHDIDIATSARPDEVQALFPRTIAVGAQFGVIMVLQEGVEFQVATFRKDGTYSDARRPDAVTFTDAEEDARRRDFTVNGLFFDPVSEEVIDYVDGRVDLQARIIRAIGDPAARFAEDRLRILRAIRFATTLDFSIEEVTWDAICTSAPMISDVSPERIREELLRVLASPRRLRGFDLLDQSGLLTILLPELEKTRGCEQPPQFHPEGDVFIHTRLMLEKLDADASPLLALAVLFHDTGKPGTATVDPDGRIRFNGHERLSASLAGAWMRKFRFSNDEREAVVEMVRQHMAFKDVQEMRTAKLRRFMDRPTFNEELELHRVDCAASHGMLDNHTFLKAKREEFASEPLVPPPLITGHDLIRLGWKPGPQFKEILDGAEAQQLEGQLRTHEEALAWVRSTFESPPSQQESGASNGRVQ